MHLKISLPLIIFCSLKDLRTLVLLSAHILFPFLDMDAIVHLWMQLYTELHPVYNDILTTRTASDLAEQ